MKLPNGTIYIALLILILGFVGGFSIKKTTYITPEGKVLVNKSYLDSLKQLSEMPPTVVVKDTVIHDTVYITQNHDPKPQPDPADTTLHIYADSLVIKDRIDVSIRFRTTGYVKGGIDWLYKPITKERIVTIERKVPVPMPYNVPVPTYKTGLYLSIAGTGNKNMFMLGSNVDLVTKNNYIYGVQYYRFGNENLFGFKIGFKLFNKN